MPFAGGVPSQCPGLLVRYVRAELREPPPPEQNTWVRHFDEEYKLAPRQLVLLFQI